MSSTRYAAEDSDLRQERWASNPECTTAINAMLAAKRIALLEDPELRAVLWFIQMRSLVPRGLQNLIAELFDFLPARVGSTTMRRLNCKAGKRYGPEVVRKIRKEIREGFYGSYVEEFPLKDDIIEDWNNYFAEAPTPRKIRTDAPASYDGGAFLDAVRKAALSLPDYLTRLCLDPEIDLAKSGETQRAGIWYFDDLIDGLKRYRRHVADSAFDHLAETEITERIHETLDFCYRQRRMVLIEGVAGVGKSITVKAWCNRYPGLVRHVELPSSNDDRSFYAAMAEALGVARGSAYTGQRIKLAVEEALQVSGLFLVLDEAQFAWPQKYKRPQGVPSRMQWIKTAFDRGAPIALVGLPEFSAWQELYVKVTLWRDNQLTRRLNRTVRLPQTHSKSDLLRIAKAIHPAGDEASWKLLAGCALSLPKKQASAISEAFISACDIAQQDGRAQVTFEDLDTAIRLNFLPVVDTTPAPAAKASDNGGAAVALPTRCRPSATPPHIMNKTPFRPRSSSPSIAKA